jgi:hypothetical protein
MDILIAVLIVGAVLLCLAIALFFVGFIGYMMFFLILLGWNAAEKMFDRLDINYLIR